MANYFPPKKWNAICYEEYIVENLEMSSIVVIAVTLYLLFVLKVGVLLSFLPCAAFHLLAYWSYRRAVKVKCVQCLDTKLVNAIDITGWAKPIKTPCPECG